MKSFFSFFSIFVLSIVMVVASVLPAGAASIGDIIFLPDSSSHKKYGEVFNSQNSSKVVSLSFRRAYPSDSTSFDPDLYYKNDLRIIQTGYDNQSEISKRCLIHIPILGSNLQQLVLIIVQNRSMATRYPLQGFYTNRTLYQTNWYEDYIPNPTNPTPTYHSYRCYEFSVFDHYVIFIPLGSQRVDLIRSYSARANGLSVSPNDSEIQYVINQYGDELESAGIGDFGAWEYLDPEEYKPSNDPDSPEFSWTDGDGNTYYGKDNPNYKWTDEFGSTYPEVSSNFGDDFGAIRGYISEIGSFSNIMSENYESQSELCSQARLQIDSLISSIPVPIFIAFGLVALVIVALKILQR